MERVFVSILKHPRRFLFCFQALDGVVGSYGIIECYIVGWFCHLFTKDVQPLVFMNVKTFCWIFCSIFLCEGDVIFCCYCAGTSMSFGGPFHQR